MKRALCLLALCSACGLANGLQGQPGGPANWAWHGPVALRNGDSGSPRVTTAQNKTWVTFASYDSGAQTGTAWITSRPDRGAWSTPFALPALPGWLGGAIYPEIAAGAQGSPVVVMEELSSNTGSVNYSVWAARLHGDSQLAASEFVRVDAASGNSQLSQVRSLAMDSDGTAVLAWGEGQNLYTSVSPGNAVWTTPKSLDTSTAGGWAGVDVAAGGGRALAGWSLGDSTAAVPLTTSGGFVNASAKRVFATGNGLAAPALALRGQEGMAIFPSGTGLGSQLYEAGSWSTVSTITTGGLAYYLEPLVSVNTKGQAVAVWRDANGEGGYAGVLKASYWDLSSWSAPVTISVPGAGRKAWWAALDINEVGQAVCAWADFDQTGTFTRIWANVLHLETGAPVWKGPVAIDQASPGVYLAGTPENVRYVGVAMDPQGSQATVVWMQHGPGTDATGYAWANWLE